MLDKFFTRWYNKGTIKVAGVPQPRFPEFCSSFSPLSYSRKGRSSGSALSASSGPSAFWHPCPPQPVKKEPEKGEESGCPRSSLRGQLRRFRRPPKKNRSRGRPQADPIPRPRLSSFNCSMKPDGQEPCTSMAVPLPPKPRLRTEAADREKPRRTERGRG